MATETTGIERRTGGAATRARILDAANELFYAHGIRATSADRIIEQVGITKVTFYRHFRSKSDLVVAYLERQSAAERAWLDSTTQEGDPMASLRAIAAGIGAASCAPSFRGCAFINAAAEYPGADDPVRIAVDAHRAALRAHFSGLAAESGADDPAAVADQFMILRDGAMVNGYLSDATTLSRSLEDGFLAILTGAARKLTD
jgi:AcrR family transcriptional regulator